MKHRRNIGYSAAMLRMAEIEVELDHIRRSSSEEVPREVSEAVAEPLRQELDALLLKWFGGKAEPPATMPE